MGLIVGLEALGQDHGPSAVSIGNFDGVHLGHRHVVQTLLSEAKQRQIHSTVVTFEPLAREYFAPGSLARLTTLEEKAELLFALGVEYVLSIRFDQHLAAMSPANFIQKILVEGLGTQFLSVGDDFKFGHQRQGDFQTLEQAGGVSGFVVQRHDTFEIDGQRVSSGRIRAAIENDKLADARLLLGRDFSISGEVAVGQKLGRTLSFPTANIELGERVVPVRGVYAVQVKLADQVDLIPGVANVGFRPTVGGVDQRLEVHLFGFDRSIYGQMITVYFKHKIRGEQKFASIEALKAQIDNDAQVAKQLLAYDPELK